MMKKIHLLLFCFHAYGSYGQLTIEKAVEAQRKLYLGSYSYHENFIGHSGYGAPVILTRDGGAAIFADYSDSTGACAVLIKLGSDGNEQWRTCIPPQYDESEAQSVIEGTDGKFYVFMLSYNNEKYRGGVERMICLDQKGEKIWDVTPGSFSSLNNPTIAYIRLQEDGKIYLRGHIGTRIPEGTEDPEYHFWEGWLDTNGKLESKTGDTLDWAKSPWKEWFSPDGK